MTADEYIVEELLQAKKDFSKAAGKIIELQKQLDKREGDLQHLTALLDIVRPMVEFKGDERLKYCTMRNVWEDDNKTEYDALKELFYIEGDKDNE